MLIDISKTFKSLYFYFPSTKLIKPLIVYLNVDDTEAALTIDMFFIGKDMLTNKLISMQIKPDDTPEIFQGNQIKKILTELKNQEKVGMK